MQTLPSQEELNRLLEYHPETGLLLWKYREEGLKSWNSRHAGKWALSTQGKKGYLYGTLGEFTVRAHRVIWKMVYGTEPNNIDHENGVRHDNRLINLKNVSVASNQRNTKHRIDNQSGRMGVEFRSSSNKYRAYINKDRKQINLGCFDTFDEAVMAREKAELDYGFHVNHGRKIDPAAQQPIRESFITCCC